MAAANRCLFSWHDVDALPDLRRLEMVIDALPDEQIIAALEQKRGRGRNDYPVRAMWRALLAGIVFQHRSIESLLRELRRNPALLELCGFDPLPRQGKPKAALERHPETGQTRIIHAARPVHDAVPSHWNFYRFLGNVIELQEQHGLIDALIQRLREQLMAALPDLGRHLGFDGKAIESHSTGRVNRETGQCSDTDADWGKHETRGIDRKTGKAWNKVKSWFGYGLHLIADTEYEIPLAFHLTPASHAESRELNAMLGELFEQTPELGERCRDFSADRGLDSAQLKARLWDEHQIRPLIDTRELWREERRLPDYDPDQPITRALDPTRADNIVHTEKGRVLCVCPQTGEQRDLAFQGFEAERNTLKYRCPAAAYDLSCAGREACHRNAGVHPGDYGRIVRIKLTEQDRRIFTPTPHASPAWQRGYNRRSALERINNRIDHGFGFEEHFIRGQSHMTVRLGLALAVMMALALGHVRQGHNEYMRSLVRSPPAAASA